MGRTPTAAPSQLQGRIRYFAGTTPLICTTCMREKEFFARFGFVHRFKRYDGYSMWVGRDDSGVVLPVTRIIDYKKNPSLHRCDARCRHAKGGNCECSCGGQFHGAGG